MNELVVADRAMDYGFGEGGIDGSLNSNPYREEERGGDDVDICMLRRRDCRLLLYDNLKEMSSVNLL